MTFACPREKCNGRIFDSLQGWKMHMSRAHGGFEDQDLIDVVGGAPGESSVKERMSTFADSIPLGGPESNVGSERPDGGLGQDRPAAEPEGKRVKATPKRAKKLVSGLLEKIVTLLKIEPDEEDKEALEEASNFLTDLFGVEFSVPQSKYVIESRFWAFLWVIGVVGLIFLKHNIKNIFVVIPIDKDGGDQSGTESSAS